MLTVRDPLWQSLVEVMVILTCREEKTGWGTLRGEIEVRRV